MAVKRLTLVCLLVSVCVDCFANVVEMSKFCGSPVNVTGPGEMVWIDYTSNTDCTVALVPHRKDVYITLHFDQADIEGSLFCYDKIYICGHRPCTPHTADLMVCSGRTGGFNGATGGTVYVRLLTNHAVTGSFTLHFYLITDPAFMYRSKGSGLTTDRKIMEAGIGVVFMMVVVGCYLLVRWQARRNRQGVNDVATTSDIPQDNLYLEPHSSMSQGGELGLEEVGSNRNVQSVGISASDSDGSDSAEISPPPTYEEVMGTPPSHTSDHYVNVNVPAHATSMGLDAPSGQQSDERKGVTSK
ncbi:uncharacterized protein LOC144859839 isoform X1 [Branchiostoma floridae x Branchiostoma japonicum]